jgi:hypothetical protein
MVRVGGTRRRTHATETRQFDEPALTAIVLATGLVNNFNRLNVMTGQVAGEWTARYAA